MVRPNFATFTLVSLLLGSPASALPLVQTESSTLAVTPLNNRDGNLGATLFFDPYNPALGPLSSVTIDLAWNVSVSAFESNPFTGPPKPLNWTPLLSASFSPFIVVPPQLALILPPATTQLTGPSIVIDPTRTATFFGLLSGTMQLAYSSPTDLAFFTTTDTARLHFNGRYSGDNSFGGSSASGNVTITVTYNVSDDAAIFWLLAGAVATLLFLPQRREMLQSR